MAAIDKVKIIVLGDSGKNIYIKQFYNTLSYCHYLVIVFVCNYLLFY